MEVSIISENRTRIIEELESITDLPTLPTVFLKAMQLMRNPNVAISEIAKVIESDPAISVKLLKLVNSSFYGLTRSIDSVQQSIGLLGINALKNIIISISIFKTLGSNDADSGFDRIAFWKHSFGVGLIARFIEKRLELGRTEEAFIGGITHDIGKVVLDKYFNKDLAAVIAETKQTNISFYQAEQKMLGISHAEIGSHLATKWNLPQKFVDTIAFHHTPNNESEAQELIALINLSDKLARKYDIGSGGDQVDPQFDPVVWDVLNIDESIITKWDEDLQQEIDQSADLIASLN